MATHKQHTISEILKIPGSDQYIDFSCVRGISDIRQIVNTYVFTIECIDINDVNIFNENKKIVEHYKTQVVNKWYKYKDK